MHIQSISQTLCNTKQTNFKSSFPVYYWHKPADEYFVTFDINTVQRYQKCLMRILNTIIPEHHNPPKSFIEMVNDYITQFDKDYKNFPVENNLSDIPFVKSAYDRKGGYKVAWNNNIFDVKPMGYIITGQDAVDYSMNYEKPISYAHKAARQYDCKKLGEMEINQAKLEYRYGGLAYAKDKAIRLKHPKTGKPLELHTIFKIDPKKKTPKLIKLGFFETGGKDNPFRTNGILA